MAAEAAHRLGLEAQRYQSCESHESQQIKVFVYYAQIDRYDMMFI